MKIFLVKFNEFTYDEYNGFVIVAESKYRAIKYLRRKHPNEIQWDKGYKIKEINPRNYKKTTIILEDFNAG